MQTTFRHLDYPARGARLAGQRRTTVPPAPRWPHPPGSTSKSIAPESTRPFDWRRQGPFRKMHHHWHTPCSIWCTAEAGRLCWPVQGRTRRSDTGSRRPHGEALAARPACIHVGAFFVLPVARPAPAATAPDSSTAAAGCRPFHTRQTSRLQFRDFLQGLLTLISGSRRPLPVCQSRRATPRVPLHRQGTQRPVARRQGPSLRVARN